MPDEPDTGRHARNALNQYLPIAKVGSVLVFVAGMIWWVANQSRDIVDARRVADEAKAAATQAAADNGALKLKEAEILTKLTSIEAQLAELRAIMLRRGPE